MQSKTFTVPNIGCNGCVNSIKNELRTIAGVETVDGSPDTKSITVTWTEPATWEAINSALVEIEYPPVEA